MLLWKRKTTWSLQGWGVKGHVPLAAGIQENKGRRREHDPVLLC